MISPEKLQALWEEIKRRVKDAEMNRPLWSALDAAKVVTLEGTTLVIGFEPHEYHLAGHLETAQNRNLVDRILQTVATKPLQMVIIEGTRMEDYQAHKAREEAMREAARKEREQYRERHDSGRILGDLGYQFHHRYSNLPHRSLVQMRAKFLLESLADLAQAEEEIKKVEDETEEAKLRQMSRAIERLASLVDMPPVLVALEFERYKHQRAS
ncbi:MAG TPA: hypothetical protein EYP85_04155 [Armatimonadetes bacterium]|nr:hypothetical protein [Armatimonadota bacterium]